MHSTGAASPEALSGPKQQNKRLVDYMTEHLITRLGHLGDGVADGPVFAPLTAPGDAVTGQLVGDHLTDIRIATPSDHRVSAPCAHFRGCGGCSLQHLRDDFVAEWKADVVRDALRIVGLEPDIRDTLTSPDKSRRRATFAARRTKKGAMVGFHGRASDAIIPVPNCILVRPKLMDAMPIAEELAVLGSSRKGALAVSVAETETGLDIAVQNGKPLDIELRTALAQLADARRLTRLSWDDETVALRDPPRFLFDGIAVEPPPGAFLQATDEGQAQLIALVQSIVGSAKQVVDLFSGCGTFALPLARNAEIQAFESDRAMLDALDKAWRGAVGLKIIKAMRRDLFRNPLLPDELNRFNAAVIDPPRAGAEAQIKQLAQSDVSTIAHVSCNPQTFARDAACLVDAGYELEWVQPVDQFRWSPHIELVGAFRK